MARRPKTGIDHAGAAGSADGGAITEHQTGLAHLVELIRHTVPTMHPAGVPFVAGPAAVAVLARRHRWIRTPATALALASATFFRHPTRVPPTLVGAVVAPADGEITIVDEAVPPADLGLGDLPLPRVSTFLSVFDVHVQRVPITGDVVSVVHTPGAFLSADLPAASFDNERTSMRIRTDFGVEIGVVQIAGLIARRIVCHRSAGDRVALGETYGLIRFGSRVDVYLPAGTVPQVLVGQRAVGAETVLATLPVGSA
ncbi:phosphatidylserine decarboxylase [Williamsia phyllosphaerae]|uniref:phosphatidylserine decarboxylase n=1 Tax=Williamsia phyllosphaerae TaxID=885042 RepID=UPI003530AEC3